MASPQKENGFTPISNELLDVIIKTNFIATQLKLILCCLRYTYGFSRKEAELSETYISKATGISKRYISQELKVLINMGVIKIIQESTYTSSRIMALNKDYETWEYRTTVPQVNCNSTVEPTQDTTVEPQCTTTVEPQFHQERKNKTRIKQDVTQKQINEFFESIWLFYPLKRGKASVSNKQKKILYDIGYNKLLSCFKKYEKEKENWRAFQQGSTFFNSGYIDYLDEESIKTKEQELEPAKIEIIELEYDSGRPRNPQS